MFYPCQSAQGVFCAVTHGISCDGSLEDVLLENSHWLTADMWKMLHSSDTFLLF